jgi:ADP-heptose:LPS heptosyltransferase
MKILIIRFSSIGDIVLTTPVIRCVKTQLPNAEVHFLTKKSFQTVVENNPYIDQLFYVDGDLIPVMMELLKERYDVIIDLHKNLRTRYVKSILTQAFNSNITKYTFSKLNVKKWLYVNMKMNLLPDRSIVERYFDGIKSFGVKNDGQGLDYFIPASDELKKDDLPTSHSLGFVACSIGGQHDTKKMPVAKWQEFCRQLDFPIVLLGGKEDAQQAEEIRTVDEVKIYNACGKFNLNESAHIIQKARFVISHDTGLMHIAAAFKKPIISIWGNTVPAFGMFPYYGYNNINTNIAPTSYIYENKKVRCRPCSKIGYSTCPKKHFNCMNKLDIAELLAVSKRFMKEK